MAKFISDIHDRINFAIKKGLTGYYPPEKITDEVHAESLKLWNTKIEDFEKTKVMDIYLRDFQNTEIVRLNNGISIYSTTDYIYSLEGVSKTGFSSSILVNAISMTQGSNPNTVALASSNYPPGYDHWIFLSVPTYSSPVSVIVKVDDIVVYRGQITNKQAIIPYTYNGQKEITVTITGSATVTFSLWQITMVSNNIEIHWVDNQKFLFRASHPVKMPTNDYPIGSNFSQNLEILPATAFDYAFINYLKRPTKPYYAYTTSGDRYIYDDANSYDFEWNENLHPLIMERTLANLGINMRSPEMIQYSTRERQLEHVK